MLKKKAEECDCWALHAMGDPKQRQYRCTRCGAWFTAKKTEEA